jgi:exonuclease SbcD
MDSDEQKTDVITIVLTADNHLGATVPGYASRKREVFRQGLRQAFQQATDFAI